MAASDAQAAVNFVGEPGGSANGDFNNNGVVDAADYALWRDNVGSNTALPNDGGLGTPIGNAHYGLWRAGFGNSGGGGNTLAFEDPSNWTVTQYDPPPSVGLESTPPGSDSIWFAENNMEDVVIVLSDERSGQNGTQPMGTFSYGGETAPNDFNTKITLVLNNSVTLTAQERDDGGEPRPPGSRALRIGREDVNPVSTAMGGTTETAPWGILLHKAGTLQYDPVLVTSGANMDFSRDKPNSAGAVYEIGGNAVLNISGSVRLGDRDNGGVRTTPGAIFRVRGSDATINVEDFINESRLGLWDHDNNVDANNPNGVTRMNLGKFVTEFVLDADGVSPIQVNDELRIGREEIVDGNTEIGYGFLRLKLSEPTTAGSGSAGSGDEIVLFNFGRVTGSLPSFAGSEIAEGRFVDPDRPGLNSTGDAMLPHAGLWDNGSVRADYAGATYQWTINYFEGAGMAPDPSLDNTVVLSNLMINGTPGDLDGNGSVGPSDRGLLVSTIAAPPTINIASAQNRFDLNADEVVDNLDLTVFDAHFLTAVTAAAAAVPEPGAIVLALTAAFGLMQFLRRRDGHPN